MNMNRINSIILALVAGLAASHPATAQTTTLFLDNYNRSSLTVGAPTLYSTNVTAGDGGGSLIASQFLRLTNDASASSNSSGRVFVTGETTSFTGFQKQLHANAGELTWSFNGKSNRTSDPGGFATGNYGLAVILGATGSDLMTANGYAIVYGNPGSPDSIRLVRFTGGVDADTNLTNLLSSGAADLAGFSNFFSVKVSYTPSSDTWRMSVRDDGASSWTDPATAILSGGGGIVDSTYTSTPLTYFGYAWNYNSAANQSVQFDNFQVTQASQAVAPEPLPLGLLLLGLGVLGCRYRA